MTKDTLDAALKKRGLTRFLGPLTAIGPAPVFGGDFGSEHGEGTVTALRLAVEHGVLREVPALGRYAYIRAA